MTVFIPTHNRSTLYKNNVGAATLVFSILVLLLVTFVTLYTSKSIITETRITNNISRAAMAFQAAEAGVAIAMEALEEGRRTNRDGGMFGAETDSTPTNSKQFSVGASQVTVSVTSSQIISVGVSDDGTASKTITVEITQNDAIANIPENPWITRGSSSFTGSSTVYNQEGASTVWTGGAVNVSGSNDTYIANPQDTSYPECMETSFSCEVALASYDGSGLDVIANDATLASLTQEEFFMNFFGYSSSDYKKYLVDRTVDIDAGDTLPVGLSDEIVWIDGDITINSSGVYGCDYSASGSSHPNGQLSVNTSGETICQTSNGEIKPITLIVNGDLQLGGSPKIYGVVFVLGDVSGSGTIDIVGAMMVDGQVNFAGGDLSVWYNSDVIEATTDTPTPFAISGGWRDF